MCFHIIYTKDDTVGLMVTYFGDEHSTVIFYKKKKQLQI